MMDSLSPAQRLLVFRHATRGLQAHYAHAMARGMSDDNLGIALHNVLGLFTSTRVAGLHLTYRGKGLCIWASRSPLYAESAPPLWRGRATLAFARSFYAIAEPLPLPPARMHLARPGAAFLRPPCEEAPQSSLLILAGPKEGQT